jgi:hypothetical protein
VSFVLVGAWYREREPVRWQELVTCLARNVANPHIAEVHLLLEEADVECPLLGHPKLRVFAHGRRATFRALFDHANRSLAGRSVIVANADIHFDDTLERVGAGDLDGALLCLSRWELGGLYEEPRSQDAWLFAAPLPDIACDFELGRPGCDNRLAWEAQRAGLRVANPARSVRAHHVHASAIRRYSERDRVPGETAEVPAITLGTLRRRRAGTPAAALAAVSFREAMGYRIARLAAGVSSHVDLERPFARIPERLAGCSFTQLVGAAMSPVAVELATSGSVYLLAERNGPASRRVRAWLRVTAEREPEADLQTTHDNGFEAWSVTGEPGDTLAVPGPVLLVAATLARAADLAPSVAVPRIDAIEAAPLVSCIMPTADRREHVVRALRYWSRQDWPERELVVVDDGALGVDDVRSEEHTHV